MILITSGNILVKFKFRIVKNKNCTVIFRTMSSREVFVIVDLF